MVTLPAGLRRAHLSHNLPSAKRVMVQVMNDEEQISLVERLVAAADELDAARAVAADAMVKRDLMILEALAAGVPERAIATAARIQRGRVYMIRKDMELRGEL